MSKNRFQEAITIGGGEIILSPRSKFYAIPLVTLPVFIGLSHSRTIIFKTTLAKASYYLWGELLYESDGMVVGNFKLNRLRRLVWLWLKLKLTRKGDFCVVSVRAFFVNFFMHSTKRYLNGQI